MRPVSIPRSLPLRVAGRQCGRAAVRCKAQVEEVKKSALESLKSLPYAPVNGAEPAKCVASSVDIDNSGDETILKIEVPDYPGLLRVISWVLNGMELRVKSASLRTSDDGLASNTLTITDLKGEKLSAKRSAAMVERVQDFVMYCSPSPKFKAPSTVSNKFAKVCHDSHPKYTVLTIFEDVIKNGFLLDVASILSGVGVHVVEAEISSGSEEKSKRVFKFLVTEEHGAKLSQSLSNTVLYVMSLMFGDGYAPLVVPSEVAGRESALV